jgi:prepilin signal peptidase PulO-like enzyme (type II secretory pathway)
MWLNIHLVVLNKSLRMNEISILFMMIAVLSGLVVGLLINYLSDVLPATRRLSLPTCPDCEGAYTLKDYLLAWRCAHCGRRHPARHPVVLLVSVVV